MFRHHDLESFEHRGRHGHFARRARHFAPFARGFMGGPGMRIAKMLASGDLQLIVLALLSEKPRHGYEIIKQIEEHTSGAYSPSPGMVYPALTYLEEMGYAESEAEGAKKLYRITEAGTKHLNENRKEVEETLEHLARFGKKISDFQKRFAEEEDDERFEDSKRGIKAEWREAKQQFRDLRHDLKEAIYDKLDAAPEERQRVQEILRRAIDEIRGK